MNCLENLLRAAEAHDRAARRPLGPALIPPSPPQALVLVTTLYTCECGTTHRSPNPHVLVRYDNDGAANSVHYSRKTAERFTMLPREHKLFCKTVPYCEDCFSAGAPRVTLDEDRELAAAAATRTAGQ